MRSTGKYTRVSTEDDPCFDVERPSDEPVAAPLRSLFQQSGTAGGSQSKPAAERSRRSFGDLSRRAPRVGAALLVASQAVALVTPLLTPLLVVGVVAGGAFEAHKVGSNLDKIESTIHAAELGLHSATHATSGEAYIESIGPGVQALAHLARSIDESHLVDKLAQVDAEALSALAQRLSAVDVESLLSSWSQTFEELQNLSVQASLRFTPAAHAATGVETAAAPPAPAPAAAGGNGLVELRGGG
jgi:hypothetical protein